MAWFYQGGVSYTELLDMGIDEFLYARKKAEEISEKIKDG